MKILILGSGGREHAMAIATKRSPHCKELLCAPGNPGMESLGRCVPIDLKDPQAMLALARKEQIDLTLVGPEVPLVAGVVDAFREAGLTIFGPSKAAAALEGSKAFSKGIMQKYGVPTAEYRTFDSLELALAYLAEHPAPIVVKASGLAAGKGAIVCLSDTEAREAVESMLGPQAIFGESGHTVVIEEFMTGEEASIFAICDGKDYVVLASAQDHKRAYDNDEGPNTGGMGAYAPAPLVTDSLLAQIKMTIIEPTLQGMQAEGIPYSGVLYVGVMVTPQGPKVVEYNCRFGDPETQVVLPLYQGDFVELCLASAQGTIANLDLQNSASATKGSAAVVVVAAEGYPGTIRQEIPLENLEAIESAGAQVFHAGTKRKGEQLVSAGGRILGVVGVGDTLSVALGVAYGGLACAQLPGTFYRKDIGKKGLKDV